MITTRSLWFFLCFILLARLLTLAVYPLMDTTEARYGEMARLMVETGNWLTPQIDYDVPFWGKPPLFLWLSALSIETLGVNEFAIRAPHWLMAVFVVACLGFFAKTQNINTLYASLAATSCLMFYIAAGAVMTDMVLTLCMTLSMTGFYLAYRGNKKFGYLGFIGLGLGLLAKGPLILILVGLAVVPWMLLQHGVRDAIPVLISRIPLISGILLMLLIAVPWYWMAERATPGFLDYFIVGEHFNRFLVSGWEGDLYGSAHDEPRGTILLFWIVAALPWSFILPILIWCQRHQLKTIERQCSGLFSFSIFWMISPLVLFTFSGNVLPAYVLPGLPALGLLIAVLLRGAKSTPKSMLWLSAITPAIMFTLVAYLLLGADDRHSDKFLLQNTRDSSPVFYVGKRPFSGRFYSSGKAKLAKDLGDLKGLGAAQIVGKPKDVAHFISQNKLTCQLLYAARSQRVLYHCRT
ncbi:MAG: phospholipid carrier-dependent glycosyltransferase [Pseudomonadota bacterium]